MPEGDISVKTVAALPLAAVRRQVTAATITDEIVKAPIWTLAASRHLRSSDTLVVVYHDNPRTRLINQPGGVAIDIGVVVAKPFEGDQVLQFVETPGGRVAHTRLVGHYEMLPVIHGDIRAWCLGNGHEIAGINWEYYARWDEDPHERITDIYYLLR